MTVFRDLQSTARRHGAPATFGLIVAIVASFLLSWATGGDWALALAFDPVLFPKQPWSVLTYPFAFPGNDLLGVALSCLMLWWFGSAVERELGAGRYLAFFAAMTLLPAGFLSLGDALQIKQAQLFGAYLPLAGITVAWATRNPNATILLMFVLPVLAKWVGWITVAAVLLGYGYKAPLFGVLAALHLGVAYAYAANRIPFLPWGRGADRARMREAWLQRERDDKYFESVRQREKEREERERLRKLFEGSMGEDERKD